ncbi:MAG: hypothetical protein DRJ41_03455 [Thermoprotei archaeon]|nr:MAG: hypothetical protein DRJ41_03455 [Thermoprotei archaeon]
MKHVEIYKIIRFLLLISGLFPSGFYFYEVRIILDAFYLKSRNIIYKFTKLNCCSVILLVFIVYYLITLTKIMNIAESFVFLLLELYYLSLS